VTPTASLANAVRVTWPLTGLLTTTLEIVGAMVSGVDPPPPQAANMVGTANATKNLIFNTSSLKILKF
jgi:hypothetical protein